MDIQNRVKEFVEDKNLKSSVNIRIMDLTSEIGELNKEFLKITDYGKKILPLMMILRKNLEILYFL